MRYRCGAMSEHPFRDPAPGAIERGALERALEAARGRGRAGSKLSVTPLLAIAVAFCLPTARGCQHLVSGADMLVQNPGGTVLVLLAPYLFALLLGLATAFYLSAAREPEERALRYATRSLGLYGLGAFVGASAVFLVNAHERKPEPMAIGLALAAVVVVGAVRLMRVTRKNGWFDWCALLSVYALFTVGWTPSWVVVGAVRGGEGQAGLGAYVYLAAWAIVLVSSLWGAWALPKGSSTEVAGPS